MPWFNLFSGLTAEKLEQKGDALCVAGFWGAAKLEYERAHRKCKTATGEDRDHLRRLVGKITETKEALSHEHQQNALELVAIGDFKEALDLVELAQALTADDALITVLAQQHREIESILAAERRQTQSTTEDEWLSTEDRVGFQSPEEQFRVLCGMLPDPVRRAYMEYGADFKIGYLALNNGDYETAQRHLTRSLETCNAADSYIPLELASAYLQLDRPEKARELLEKLLEYHPDTLPAYQLLTEIYWEQGAFGQADALLASVPGELAMSRAVFLLKGETLFQAGHFDVAKTFYQDFLATYGWDESIAFALARTHEALNDLDDARRTYQEIMGHCSGCHRRIDPLVKEKFADLSFAAGIHDTAILELYLALAQEQPENAAMYYAKVSRIYQTLGNQTEAKRFSALADQMMPK